MSPTDKHSQTAANLLLPVSLVAICLGAMAANPPVTNETELYNLKGQQIGTAVLTQTRQGVKIRLDATNLPPNATLAFHIHQIGLCDAATGFKSAGDHFNPYHKEHGSQSPLGAHAGDMMNVKTGPDGTLHTAVTNPSVLLDHSETGLLDLDGSALVIHAQADDYKSQPAGAAGDRIACAAIKPVK